MLRSIIISLLLLNCVGEVASQEIAPGNIPNQVQKAMQRRGYGMFIHFGPNTFADVEWSDGSIPVSQYNPTRLDPDQWVRVARDAGFRYVLLITKHHDGFCLWDSKYTDFDVASSPVKTDVVKAVSDACRKYGLDFAVYYSLWDRHEPSYRLEDKSKYIDFMCNQLTELLTNYGDVCELWFDGGWDRKVADWDLDRVYRHVKSIQPKCAVGVNHTIELTPGSRRNAHPDSMTVDNKYGFQYFPSDFRLWDPKIANRHDKKQYVHDSKSYYMPFEHTICLSKAWTWFQKSDNCPVRDLDELEELFYWCTDNGNTLVVNVPPDKTGRIREHEADQVIALGRRLNLRRGKPLPKEGSIISAGAPVEASSQKAGLRPGNVTDGGIETRWEAGDTISSLTITLDPEKKFDKIAIFEYCDMSYGNDGFSTYRSNRITHYDIEVLRGGEWRCIYCGNEPMGDCKVIRLSRPCQAEKLRLNVRNATAPASICEINIIDTSKK